LLFGDVPDSADPVAGDVARLLVVDEQVERHAVIGPHLLGLAVGVDHVEQSPFVHRLGAIRGQQRGPFLDAVAGAGRRLLSLLVLLEGVERHPLAIDPDLATGAVGDFGRFIGSKCAEAHEREQQGPCDGFEHDRVSSFRAVHLEPQPANAAIRRAMRRREKKRSDGITLPQRVSLS